MAEENVTEQPQNTAPAPAEAVTEAPLEEPKVEQPTPSIEDTVKDVLREQLGSWQGGFADTFGRKTKELEEKIHSSVDSRLTQYEDRLKVDEEARVANLEPEDQTEYWKQRAIQQEQVQAAPEPQQQKVEPRIEMLLSESKALMSRYGVTGVTVSDPNLWVGFREGMSLKESLDVLEGNLKSISAPAKPATAPPAPSTQSTTVPPQTTQGAPQKTAKSVNTLSEAAALFADGNINSIQYRNIKKQLDNGGSANIN